MGRMIGLKKEKIIDELKKYVDFYENAAKAWDAVKFPTKKDGSEFKSFERNFVGATIINEPFIGKKIVVNFQTKFQGHVSDTASLKALKNGEKFTFFGKELDAARAVSAPMFSPFIELNVAETKTLIQRRAKSCWGFAEKRRKQLDGIEEKMDKLEKSINQSLADCGLADLSRLIGQSIC